MLFLGVVLEFSLDGLRDLADGLGEIAAALGDEEEAERTARVGGGLGEGVQHVAEDGLDELGHGGDEVQVEPDALGLSGEDAVGGQSVLAGLEVGLTKELGGRAFRIGRVGDDDIKLVLVLLDVLVAVTNVDLDARVVVALGNTRKELLGVVNDHLVDFADVDFFHTGVSRNFAEHTTVTTTDHEDLLGVGVSEQGNVGNRFLVRELIALSDLDSVIQHQGVSVRLALEEENVLVG